MHYLKSLYFKIVQLGIEESDSHFLKLRIKIINQFTIIIAIGTFLGGLFGIYNREPDFYNAFFMTLTSILVLYLIHHRKLNATRFYCTYVYPIFVFYLVIIYGSELKLEFGYGAFILSSVFIYETNKERFINISFIIVLLIIGFYYTKNYDSIYASSVNFIDTLIVVSISLLCCFLLLKTYFDESKVYYGKQFGLINKLEVNNNELSKLIDINKTKNDLITILAHDLKGPAASFQNLTKKLQYLIKENDRERIIEMSHHYESQGNVLFYNLDNLLNWVLSQREEIKPINEEIAIHTFINEIIKWQRSFTRKETIKITNQIDPDLFLESDKNILKIIVSNILNNAIKFSADKGKIIISSSFNKNFFSISFIDFGSGIEADKLAAFSNRNVQFMDSLRSDGHGLGLKTCIFLIKKLKGKIKIKSKLNEGTIVDVSLPIASISQHQNHISKTEIDPIFK
jgi:signal transduction histidine kinase